MGGLSSKAHVSVSHVALLSRSLLSRDLETSFQVSGREYMRCTWFSTCSVKMIVHGMIWIFETETPRVGLFCSLVLF